VYGVLGLRQINTCRIVPSQVNFLRLRHFALPSMSLIFVRLKRNRHLSNMASGLFHHCVPVDVGEKAQTKPEIVEKSVDYRIFPHFSIFKCRSFSLKVPTEAWVFRPCFCHTIKGYLRPSRIFDIFSLEFAFFHWQLYVLTQYLHSQFWSLCCQSKQKWGKILKYKVPTVGLDPYRLEFYLRRMSCTDSFNEALT
jgi:hypothetical protein